MMTNGIITSLGILLLSIFIMLFIFYVINRSMKPLMELFDSITFVMNQAQEGNYSKRVRYGLAGMTKSAIMLCSGSIRCWKSWKTPSMTLK